MALKLVFTAPGKLRTRNWYGVFKAIGGDGLEHRRVLPLGVVVPEGCRVPSNLREIGNATFERSRGAAQAAFDELAKKVASDRVERRTLERLVELKTGERPQSVLLAKPEGVKEGHPDVAEAWDSLAGKRGEQYRAEGLRRIKHFVEFIRARFPRVSELAQVTPSMAAAWMKAHETRGLAPKSYNIELTFWRSLCGRLADKAGIQSNPFACLRPRKLDTCHKRAFTEKELVRILEMAKEKAPDLYPLILTCACTGLRKGDAATLRWGDVDLSRGFIRHPQSKTGNLVEIPIVGPLRDFLANQRTGAPSAAIFLDLADRHKTNPDRLTREVQAVLAEALGLYTPKEGESKTSFYLRVATDQDNLLRKPGPKGGLARRNEIGLHAFRTTLASLLLNKGMAAHLVAQITGHAAVATTMKHYYRSDRESLRHEMESRVSGALMLPEPEQVTDEKPTDPETVIANA